MNVKISKGEFNHAVGIWKKIQTKITQPVKFARNRKLNHLLDEIHAEIAAAPRKLTIDDVLPQVYQQQ